MPLSRPDCIKPVIEFVWENNVQSILDVGMGFGGYGVLFRQTMDVRWGRVEEKEWTAVLDGVEIEERYKNPAWEVYSKIYIGDAKDVLRSIEERGNHYQLIFLGDVLEHFTKEDGKFILEMAKSMADSVIVTTPNSFAGNEAEAERFHNDHEAHECLIEESDMEGFTREQFGNQQFFLWRK